MTREPKPGGRAERLARLEWEVSELRHSIQTLRWMVAATLAAVVLPLLFQVPPFSWIASAVSSTLTVIVTVLGVAALVALVVLGVRSYKRGQLERRDGTA